MRTFDHVDNKLFEADFFAQKMDILEFDWFAMRCYFSAFVSSSRSVTFAMQASMKGIGGFAEWYANIQGELRNNEMDRFFHECRTDDQKIGFNHIVGGVMRDGRMDYWFSEHEQGKYNFTPKTDVLTSCKEQMVTLCKVVDQAYSAFGLEIDPDQRYTPEGLKALGYSLEDLEEDLGLPRGHTDIEWDSGNKDLERLEQLRRQIPGSSVKPLLSKYLCRDLTYPVDRFRAPRP
jgi:hypothetical protein